MPDNPLWIPFFDLRGQQAFVLAIIPFSDLLGSDVIGDLGQMVEQKVKCPVCSHSGRDEDGADVLGIDEHCGMCKLVDPRTGRSLKSERQTYSHLPQDSVLSDGFAPRPAE